MAMAALGYGGPQSACQGHRQKGLGAFGFAPLRPEWRLKAKSRGWCFVAEDYKGHCRLLSEF